MAGIDKARSSITVHPQEWVKVNAHVDAGALPLVRALSAFPKLRTIESCQNTASGSVWVCFQYGEDQAKAWQDLSEFVLGYFGPGLAGKIGDLATVAIIVTSFGFAQGELSVSHEATVRTVKAIGELAHDWKYQRGRPYVRVFL